MSTSTRLEHPGRSIHAGVRRRRIVLSCLICKRRKVECDRQGPICIRCTEGGYPEQCRWDDLLSNAEEDAPDMHSFSPELLPSPVAEVNPNLPVRDDTVGDASNLTMPLGEPLNRINTNIGYAPYQPALSPVTEVLQTLRGYVQNHP